MCLTPTRTAAPASRKLCSKARIEVDPPVIINDSHFAQSTVGIRAEANTFVTVSGGSISGNLGFGGEVSAEQATLYDPEALVPTQAGLFVVVEQALLLWDALPGAREHRTTSAIGAPSPTGWKPPTSRGWSARGPGS